MLSCLVTNKYDAKQKNKTAKVWHFLSDEILTEQIKSHIDHTNLQATITLKGHSEHTFRDILSYTTL